MKILLLSDIHANIHALEAVWKRECDSDLVCCAGDLVDWGPFPSEVISWIRAHRVACVRGNHDDQIVARHRSGGATPAPGEPIDWVAFTASQLDETAIRFLETLPLSLTFEDSGILHGVTHLWRGYDEIVSPYAFDAFSRRVFSPDGGNVPPPARIILGHTHRQAVRYLAGDRPWINPGSVSYRRPDDPDQTAHYAVIEDGRISLRRATYDTRPVHEAVTRLRLTPTCSQSAWFFAPAPEPQADDDFFSDYAAAWRRVENAWPGQSASDGLHLWRTYSANYLFRQHGLVWAVDPFLPHAFLGRPYPAILPRPLRDLDVVLLTHEHPDHWDEHLYRRLAGKNITWLVPPFLKAPLLACGVPESRVVVLASGDTWSHEAGLFHIRAHEGWHWEGEDCAVGCPCAAWQVDTLGRRLMFFGDVRTYDPALFPAVRDVGISFAHVWLGRADAVNATPVQLDAFCRFHEHFSPREIVLAHLDERSRDITNLWTSRHAALLRSRFKSTSPGILVRAPGLLESVFWPALSAARLSADTDSLHEPVIL